MTERKPMKVGLDYVRGAGWKPILFTRKGALNYMGKTKSPLRLAGVSDCGDYWRGNNYDQPTVT
jgi:hypothetical protein